MLTNGVITQEEHDAAQAEDLNLNVSEVSTGDGMYKYKYFTSYVRETLLKDYSADEVFKGGMTVVTTLDPAIQEAAESAADAKMNGLSDNLELALVSVTPIPASSRLLSVDVTTTPMNSTWQRRQNASRALPSRRLPCLLL